MMKTEVSKEVILALNFCCFLTVDNDFSKILLPLTNSC